MEGNGMSPKRVLPDRGAGKEGYVFDRYVNKKSIPFMCSLTLVHSFPLKMIIIE